MQLYQEEKTSAQVVSCKLFEIFKNSYFEEHVLTNA